MEQFGRARLLTNMYTWQLSKHSSFYHAELSDLQDTLHPRLEDVDCGEVLDMLDAVLGWHHGLVQALHYIERVLQVRAPCQAIAGHPDALVLAIVGVAHDKLGAVRRLEGIAPHQPCSN